MFSSIIPLLSLLSLRFYSFFTQLWDGVDLVVVVTSYGVDLVVVAHAIMAWC